MNIGSGSAYPANALSNFAPHPFIFDGVECNSMEGLLQSFKFENPAIQVEVCKLVGYAAKKRGKEKNWQRTQTLWWKGIPYKRDSEFYQKVLDNAYYALSKNKKFCQALLASGDAVLSHSIGRTNKSETVLTVQEFCSRLTKIRSALQKAMGV